MHHSPISTTDATALPLLEGPLVLTAGQVAHLLGISEETFRGRRQALEASCGFPPRLPGLPKWSRACVVRWVETNGLSFAPPAAAGLADEMAALEADYAGGAQ